MKRGVPAIGFLVLIAACSGEAVDASSVATDTTAAESATTTSTITVPETPATSTTGVAPGETGDLTGSWAYGLVSVRTGEPLIAEGMEHRLDPGVISYGYNLVIDASGMVLEPQAVPLEGGETLVLTDDYQEDLNTREFARVFTIMAPIRDAILYHYETLSRDQWLQITEVLTLNGIKIEDAAVVDGRSVLSTTQVYDYIATGSAEGSPIARYLEEAGLELKCLAFVDFDFTNPEGANHCLDHGLVPGSGIELP